MRSLGFTIEKLQAPAIAALEPALDVSRLAGAVYAPQDEAGDAAHFCRTLAAQCRTRGVSFYLENEILSIEPIDVRIREVVTRRGRVRADAFVCALGVMDHKLREQLGTQVPVYPVKGFSATLPIVDPQRAPKHAAIDETRRVAFAPMGEELRVTGGAQFAGYGREHEPQHFATLFDTLKQLYPGAVDYGRARMRACQRPMTPETRRASAPAATRTCGSTSGLDTWGFDVRGAARITAELLSGNSAPIDLEGLRIRRH